MKFPQRWFQRRQLKKTEPNSLTNTKKEHHIPVNKTKTVHLTQANQQASTMRSLPSLSLRIFCLGSLAIAATTKRGYVSAFLVPTSSPTRQNIHGNNNGHHRSTSTNHHHRLQQGNVYPAVVSSKSHNSSFRFQLQALPVKDFAVSSILRGGGPAKATIDLGKEGYYLSSLDSYGTGKFLLFNLFIPTTVVLSNLLLFC